MTGQVISPTPMAQRLTSLLKKKDGTRKQKAPSATGPRMLVEASTLAAQTAEGAD